MSTTQTGGGNGAAPDGGFSLSTMVGKRLHGVKEKDDELIVIFVGGLDDDECSEYRFAHEQSCCAYVRIERYVSSIAPDSAPAIQSATVWVWADETPEILGEIDMSAYDSYTWTRLVIDTDGGSLEVVWLGMSNGYYNENVSIRDGDDRYVRFGDDI